MKKPFSFNPGILLVTAGFILVAGCGNEKTVYAEKKDLVEAVYASGKIVAADEQVISALYTGLVADKKVREGDTVKKGQLLYVLQRETPAMRVQSKDKDGGLLGGGNISMSITSSDTRTDPVYVRSSAAGIVYQTLKENGELVRATEPLLLMGSGNKPLVRLLVDQQDVTKVRPGQLVLVKTELTADSIYEGEVIRVYPVMNEASQSFRVDVAFRNDPAISFLHQSAEGNIIIGEKKDALVLPVSLVTKGDSIRVKREGKKEWVRIKTGIRGMDHVEVTEGLDEKTAVLSPDNKP